MFDRRLHHTKLPQYMRDMKKYHLAHHYKNFELGFGVTSTCPLNIGFRICEI
jgi:sterol desaturase/sphingolipid hydroxylase (fatty acid hydroxylase superfamily)